MCACILLVQDLYVETCIYMHAYIVLILFPWRDLANTVPMSWREKKSADLPKSLTSEGTKRIIQCPYLNTKMGHYQRTEICFLHGVLILFVCFNIQQF